MRTILTMLLVSLSLLLLVGCSGKEEAKPEETKVSTELPSSIPPSDMRLVGDWSFKLQELELQVHYRADGTFTSETERAGAKLQIVGTYSFDGRRLVATPVKITSDAMNNPEVASMIEQMNSRLIANPESVVERSEVVFDGTDRYTATIAGQTPIVYERIK